MRAHDLIKRTKKILTEPQYKFLKQLAYWSLNSKDYGLKKDGKTWIYNTHQQWAEQICYGVTTVRESIAYLEQIGFISSDFLHPNKRRRVKYYSINFETIENYFAKSAQKKEKVSEKNPTESSAVSTVFESSEQQLDRQMERQMYTNNKIQDNKSYKSQDQKVPGASYLGKDFDSTVCRVNENDYSDTFDTEGKGTAKDGHTSVSKNLKTECNVTLPLRGERQECFLDCGILESYTDSTVCQTNDKNYSDTEEIVSAKDSHTHVSENLKIGSGVTLAAGTTCLDMIKIWNQEFPNQKIVSGSTEQVGIVHLTKQLARFLVASFKLKFKNSLEKWRRYLRLIKTSTYLMGEKFKLSVWWVIKFLTIDRIRAGELGVDESKIQIDQSEIEQKAIAHADSVDESETCKQYRREIICRLSPAVYLSWFTKVDLIEESKNLVIKATNDFVRDYIKANFLDKIGEFGKSRVCSEIL